MTKNDIYQKNWQSLNFDPQLIQFDTLRKIDILSKIDKNIFDSKWTTIDFDSKITKFYFRHKITILLLKIDDFFFVSNIDND